MDQVASISAAKHSRLECVTASVDTVEFLHPIRPTDSVIFESFVIWTGKSSMEIFIKVYAETLLTGESKVSAIAYFTFIALDDNGKPAPVPKVIPETEEERYLYEKSKQRTQFREDKRAHNKEIVSFLRSKV